METKLNPTFDARARSDSNVSVNDQLDQLTARENIRGASTAILANESQRSMGEILSSVNQELHQSVTEPELLAEKPMPKLTNSVSGSAKKSMFWGKKNVSFFSLTLWVDENHYMEVILITTTAGEEGVKWLVDEGYVL